MTANAYRDSLDIARRACVHLGVQLIQSVDEKSQRNVTITEVYDKLRQDELRRNLWVFSKRKVVLRAIDGTTTRTLHPQEWQVGTYYPPGSIVRHCNGQYWHSVISENQGNEPGVVDAWDAYFGPRTVHLWDSTQQYYPGELVYIPHAYSPPALQGAMPANLPPNPGQFVIYLSKGITNIPATNADDPTNVATWDTTVTYKLDDLVLYAGQTWRSVIAINKGITPQAAPNFWNIGHTYGIGDQVVGPDGYIYTSTANSNLGFTPIDTTNGKWTNTNVPFAWNNVPQYQGSSLNWLPIYSGLRNVSLDYLGLALGASVSLGTSLAVNTFMLPAGYLRSDRLSHKFATPEDDREKLGEFVTSKEPIILFPFCADVTNVRAMDPMFCEGVAARIAYETAETLTQSTGKKREIASAYTKFMGEARIINAIEAGPEEPDEDTFISVRRMGYPWQVG